MFTHHHHHMSTHTKHIHTPHTPDSTFLLVFCRPISLLSSLSSLSTHTPCPSSFVPPTQTSPTKMHTVLGSRNPPLGQMRTWNEVCYCWQCVCLICCRGGNCDSRTYRRNPNRHPQIGRASVVECVLSSLSLSLLLFLSVFICVCHELCFFSFNVFVLSIGVTCSISLVQE